MNILPSPCKTIYRVQRVRFRSSASAFVNEDSMSCGLGDDHQGYALNLIDIMGHIFPLVVPFEWASVVPCEWASVVPLR